jgi:ABC-type glycerol-3-phosphate transport system substrate-binding protein
MASQRRYASHRLTRSGLLRGLLILLVSILATGCAVQATQADPDSSEIVVLWHTFTGQEARAIEKLTDRFNAVNPWDTVLVTEYQEGLPERFADDQKRRPDLVTLWPREFQAYRELGVISANPYTSAEIRRVRAGLLPMAEALYTVDDTPQALPLGLMTYFLYYNEDWIRNLGYEIAGANRDTVRSAACAVTNPLERQEGLGMPAQADMLLAWLTAGGAQITEGDGAFAFADDPGKATIEWLNTTVEGGCIRIHQDWISGQALLGQGAMVMVVESSLNYPAVVEAVNQGQNFPIGVSPLPGAEGSGPTLWYGPGMLVTAPEGEQQDAAFRVMAWFLSDEAQTMWGEMTDYIPARRPTIQARLDEEDSTLDDVERQIWALTLQSAQEGSWVDWPHATYYRSCRAALLRSLLALGTEEADPAGYINAAVTSCNTTLRSSTMSPTPASNTQEETP